MQNSLLRTRTQTHSGGLQHWESHAFWAPGPADNQLLTLFMNLPFPAPFYDYSAHLWAQNSVQTLTASFQMVSCPEHCSCAPCIQAPLHNTLQVNLNQHETPNPAPVPPKFLLVHTTADLRHSDVGYLVYRLLTNDRKPVWFPLSSLCTVNITGVTCFSLKLQLGTEKKNGLCFLLKAVSLQKQYFYVPCFSIFS